MPVRTPFLDLISSHLEPICCTTKSRPGPGLVPEPLSHLRTNSHKLTVLLPEHIIRDINDVRAFGRACMHACIGLDVSL